MQIFCVGNRTRICDELNTKVVLFIDILEFCQLVKLLVFTKYDHRTGFIIILFWTNLATKKKLVFVKNQRKKNSVNSGTNHLVKKSQNLQKHNVLLC